MGAQDRRDVVGQGALRHPADQRGSGHLVRSGTLLSRRRRARGAARPVRASPRSDPRAHRGHPRGVDLARPDRRPVPDAPLGEGSRGAARRRRPPHDPRPRSGRLPRHPRRLGHRNSAGRRSVARMVMVARTASTTAGKGGRLGNALAEAVTARVPRRLALRGLARVVGS